MIVVYCTLAMPSYILTEASLSFLGMAVPKPTPAWGSLVYDGLRLSSAAPWVFFYPGLFISATVISLNVRRDAARDALDPARISRSRVWKRRSAKP